MRLMPNISLTEKEDDETYTGMLVGYKIEYVAKNGKVNYEKDYAGRPVKKRLGKVRVFASRIENELTVSLQAFSYEDEDRRK